MMEYFDEFLEVDDHLSAQSFIERSLFPILRLYGFVVFGSHDESTIPDLCRAPQETPPRCGYSLAREALRISSSLRAKMCRLA